MENNPFTFLILAAVVACIAWTITKEEVFRESREFCSLKSKSCNRIWKRKFFYVFTCEYCFSHYVTLLLLVITGYKLIYTDWVGLVIAGFTIVWTANIYMSLYSLIRIDLKKEKIEAEKTELQLKKIENTNQ
ncbi:hypothetical protein [Pedobacter rhizosphaerae]|uniref:DUF1360 domain-containing protein n=1 Tax=Pedobacter rhizosphaerae TaxID=390241 RepID=A0A1H9WA55_9SPHI|nr:hypothetical protein [Pedobacter rhizosphaerae]SES30836.1 hypothetical protein SAMN04488023_1665 [Pedobacter rhizosphaerae]